MPSQAEHDEAESGSETDFLAQIYLIDVPSRAENNWHWRFLPGHLKPALSTRLRELNRECGRVPAWPYRYTGAHHSIYFDTRPHTTSK